MQARKFIKLLPLILGTGASFINGCKFSNEKNISNVAIETNAISLDEEQNVITVISKEDIIKEYQSYFNEDIKYRNDELYLNDKDIDNLINISKITPKYNYQFDGDIDKVISDIENNSVRIDDSNLESAFNQDNKELLESTLKEIFNKIKEENNNLDSDFHIIDDLKIYTYKEEDIDNNPCLYIEENNSIIINYNEIIELAKYYNISYEEQLKYFIIQEINRVRKNTYEGDIESSLNYKSTNDTLMYNGTNGIELFTKNIISNNLDQNIDYIYNDEIKAQGELLLLGITNQDSDVLNKYFNAVNDNNLKELWEVYNLKDKNDLNHFYKILYSMDAKLHRNPMIYDYYNSNSKVDFEDFVGHEYKIDLFTKSVSNLMEYQKANDISVEENLVLYNIILNAIVNDTYKYNDNFEIEYDMFFMNKINELNNNYIEYLSKYYELSEAEINDLIRYDTRFILIDMASIMHNDDNNIPEYLEDAKALLDKYPLTKAIMASDYIYTTQFQKAIDNTKENTKSL